MLLNDGGGGGRRRLRGAVWRAASRFKATPGVSIHRPIELAVMVVLEGSCLEGVTFLEVS